MIYNFLKIDVNTINVVKCLTLIAIKIFYLNNRIKMLILSSNKLCVKNTVIQSKKMLSKTINTKLFLVCKKL